MYITDRNIHIFVSEWLKRAERKNVYVDDGDRFISLWIAFNAWARMEYGEDVSDRDLIDSVIEHSDLDITFELLKIEDKEFVYNLSKLEEYVIVNMKNPKNVKLRKKYEGSFESFINVIYQIRCNLFHGRKSISDNKRDFRLVVLALRLFYPLFKKFVKDYNIA